MITEIFYQDPLNDSIRVFHDDSSVWDTPWPCSTWHLEVIQAFLDGGGEIYLAAPDDSYTWNDVSKVWEKDITLIKEDKIEDTKQEAYRRMSIYVEPYADEDLITLDKKKIQAGMISLPNPGSSMDKCVQIWDYFVTQRGLIEAMVTIAEVEAYDPVADIGWPY